MPRINVMFSDADYGTIVFLAKHRAGGNRSEMVRLLVEAELERARIAAILFGIEDDGAGEGAGSAGTSARDEGGEG